MQRHNATPSLPPGPCWQPVGRLPWFLLLRHPRFFHVWMCRSVIVLLWIRHSAPVCHLLGHHLLAISNLPPCCPRHSVFFCGSANLPVRSQIVVQFTQCLASTTSPGLTSGSVASLHFPNTEAFSSSPVGCAVFHFVCCEIVYCDQFVLDPVYSISRVLLCCSFLSVRLPFQSHTLSSFCLGTYGRSSGDTAGLRFHASDVRYNYVVHDVIVCDTFFIYRLSACPIFCAYGRGAGSLRPCTYE